jgi:hypothetical protein
MSTRDCSNKMPQLEAKFLSRFVFLAALFSSVFFLLAVSLWYIPIETKKY